MIPISQGLAVALAVAVLGLGVQEYRVAGLKADLSETKAQASKERAEAEQKTREQEQKFRQMERKIADEQDRIRDEASIERQRLQTDLSASRDNAQRLLRQLATVGAVPRTTKDPSSPSGSPAARADLGVFTDVLGECVTRVQRLADAADASRSAGNLCERTYDALTVGGRP